MTVEVVLPANLAVKPPEFLNEKLFQEVLEYALHDCQTVNLTKISFDAGSTAGDNFLGVIYRVRVHFKRSERAHANEESLSCIVKFIPNSEANAFLHELNVYLKEKVMYRDVLPRMNVLYDGPQKFCAKLYHTVMEPLRTFFFEDLSTCQYEMANREMGLNEAHSCMTLQKLGKFHATSMILGKKDPGIMKCFHTGLISKMILRDGGLPLRYYGGEIAVLEATVRSWPGYTTVADKIAKFRENFRDNLLRSVAPMENDILVLNHGDLWVNNVLFKYDKTTKAPIDCTFVDYQMSLWGSLGIDLNYFFNTSVQLSVLRERREYLLRVYYDSLRGALMSQKVVAVPTFEQIKKQVERREGWGFFAAFAILPLISLDKDAASDNNLDNMNNDDFALQKMQKMFGNPRVQEILKFTLKRFEELGVLDV